MKHAAESIPAPCDAALPDPAALLREIDALIAQIRQDAQRQSAQWQHWDIRPEFRSSADNLAAYLALRHHDLRGLQRKLMALGLSSLGRLESRVMPAMAAVRSALQALSGERWVPEPEQQDYFAGETRLAQRVSAFFGAPERPGRSALMVTCPTDAAADPAFFSALARRGVEALRINCAHDDGDIWFRMIAHARAAQAETGQRMRIFMDLGGPKVRTGAVRALGERLRLQEGDAISLVAPGLIDRPAAPGAAFVAECTLPELFAAVKPGQRLLIDDGAIATSIETVEGDSLTARVTRCKPEGAKFKPGKGINAPDAELNIAALTDKDRRDLAFVAAHADGIGYSFVQSAQDVALLQEALAALRPHDWDQLALILKIETARAVRNLPDILVRASARQPSAIMIARGDLAIEIGFARLAEMQEEILWIGEAAQVPVTWATQVLEQLVKTGVPSRGELTDAAMAARADCVMLNKGAYLLEAVDALDHLLGRMEGHVHKKTPQLRRLLSW